MQPERTSWDKYAAIPLPKEYFDELIRFDINDDDFIVTNECEIYIPPPAPFTPLILLSENEQLKKELKELRFELDDTEKGVYTKSDKPSSYKSNKKDVVGDLFGI